MKKYIYRILFLLLLFILTMMYGCNTYFTPEKYAQPKHKYEVRGRRVY